MNIFDFYAGIYDWFMKSWHLYKPKVVMESLKLGKADIVLDVGGGTGYIANEIAKECKEVVVLDSSSKMLQQAKRYQRNVALSHANALSIPFKDEYFDAVIFTDSLHHIKNVDLALKEAYRVVRKDGKIVILDYSKKYFLGKILYLFELVWIEKIKFLEPEELLEKCLDIGFNGEIKRISSFEYLFVGEK